MPETLSFTDSRECFRVETSGWQQVGINGPPQQSGSSMLFRRRKPPSNDNAPHPKAIAPASTIAADTVFEGKITTDGEIRVEGTFRGSIQSEHCTVGPNGLVEGDIEADGITVLGRIVGPLKAYHVHLKSGAHVEGSIVSQTIVIDSGAYLVGKVERSEDPFAD